MRTTLSARYLAPHSLAALPDDALALVQFGAGPDAVDDPRVIRVGLPPRARTDQIELWTGAGPVRTGRDGAIRWATDGAHCFGVVELDEGPGGDVGTTAEHAYAAALAFLAASEFPHVVRMWNYFDAINQGPGDFERYRLFCAGRAAALGSAPDEALPAATAIGRNDGDATLQVYWLSARAPGVPLENPRQVSAYRYPRQYGPRSPSFSRAMIADGPTLLISGTASVVGHATQHPGDVLAQLDETLANLDSLCEAAHDRAPSLPRHFVSTSVLKVYVRHAADVAKVDARLRERLGAAVPYLIVLGDICRADLLIEIDATHAA